MTRISLGKILTFVGFVAGLTMSSPCFAKVEVAPSPSVEAYDSGQDLALGAPMKGAGPKPREVLDERPLGFQPGQKQLKSNGGIERVDRGAFLPPSEFRFDKNTIVVLSVDGGGVRGLIPLELIRAMEEQLATPITDLVDVFGGTSVGSMVVGFLNYTNSSGEQVYTATALLNAFSFSTMKTIFSNSFIRTLRTGGGIAGARYSSKPLDAVLAKYLGDFKMSETIKPVIITSFDLTRKEIFNFSTSRANTWNVFNFPLATAIRASTAAPTYFRPYDLNLSTGAKVSLVDGGLVAVSPAMLTLAEAEKLYPDANYVVISLSTGRDLMDDAIQLSGGSRSLPTNLLDLVNIMLRGQQSLTEEIMVSRKNVKYYRFNVELPANCTSMDDTSQRNVNCLLESARGVVASDKFRGMLRDLRILQSVKAGRAGPASTTVTTPIDSAQWNKMEQDETPGSEGLPGMRKKSQESQKIDQRNRWLRGVSPAARSFSSAR